MYASGRHPAANVPLLPRRSVLHASHSASLSPSTRHPRSSPVKIDVRYPSLSYRPSCRLRRLFERGKTPDTEIDQSRSRTDRGSLHRDFFCRRERDRFREISQ